MHPTPERSQALRAADVCVAAAQGASDRPALGLIEGEHFDAFDSAVRTAHGFEKRFVRPPEVARVQMFARTPASALEGDAEAVGPVERPEHVEKAASHDVLRTMIGQCEAAARNERDARLRVGNQVDQRHTLQQTPKRCATREASARQRQSDRAARLRRRAARGGPWPDGRPDSAVPESIPVLRCHVVSCRRSMR